MLNANKDYKELPEQSRRKVQTHCHLRGNFPCLGEERAAKKGTEPLADATARLLGMRGTAPRPHGSSGVLSSQAFFKVALRETVRRALSASSTPRVVFGGGDARRRLARRAPRWTRVAWGLFLASLAAWPLRQPGARCLSSSLVPPQDRENCHIGGNVFGSFDGFAPVTLCNLYLH